MRQTTTILMIILTHSAWGQVICPRDNYDLYNYKDTINRTIDGLKQGYWINYYSTLACNDCNDCNGAHAIIEFKIDSKGCFKNDLKIGKWIYYSNNKLISRVVKFDNGRPDSIDLSYDLKGDLLSKIFWNKGKKDSVFVFYNSGSIKYKGIYKDGKFSNFKIYYLNGKLKYQASLISGSKANSLEYYNEQGQLLRPRDNDITTIGISEDVIKFMD